MKRTSLLLATAVTAWLNAPLALALPEDRSQPIEVTADSAEQDERAGTTTYTGRVQIVQGSIRIDADKVVLKSQNGKLSQIAATGGPATFQQQPDSEKGLIKARGTHLDYNVADDHIVLQQEASLEQDGSIVNGDRIDYYVSQRLVKASAAPDEPQKRVRVVIPPEAGTPTPAPTTTDKAHP